MKPNKQTQVLVIDDSNFMRKTITQGLQESIKNISITEAKNGKEAINKMKLYSYDIITLDVNMPYINGLDVLKYINSNKIKSNVMMISQQAQVNIIKESILLGARDFLTKPFTTERFKIACKRCLNVSG